MSSSLSKRKQKETSSTATTASKIPEILPAFPPFLG